MGIVKGILKMGLRQKVEGEEGMEERKRGREGRGGVWRGKLKEERGSRGLPGMVRVVASQVLGISQNVIKVHISSIFFFFYSIGSSCQNSSLNGGGYRSGGLG